MKKHMVYLARSSRLFVPLSIAACFVGSVLPSQAQSLFDSGLDGTGTSNLGDARNGKSLGFTIGSQSFDLSNIQLHLQVTNATIATNSTVFQIFSDDGSGHPTNTSLVTFETPDFVQLGVDGADLNDLIVTLTPDSSFTLQAETTYWFTAYNIDPNGSTGDIRWYYTSDSDVTIVGGGSIPDPAAYFYSNGSSNVTALTAPAGWTSTSGVYNDMVVNAIPEPAMTTAIVSMLVGALVTLRRRKLRTA